MKITPGNRGYFERHEMIHIKQGEPPMSTMAILSVLLRLRLDQIIHSEVLGVFLLSVCLSVCLSLCVYIFLLKCLD